MKLIHRPFVALKVQNLQDLRFSGMWLRKVGHNAVQAVGSQDLLDACVAPVSCLAA
jgi:hypothetical protein